MRYLPLLLVVSVTLLVGGTSLADNRATPDFNGVTDDALTDQFLNPSSTGPGAPVAPVVNTNQTLDGANQSTTADGYPTRWWDPVSPVVPEFISPWTGAGGGCGGTGVVLFISNPSDYVYNASGGYNNAPYVDVVIPQGTVSVNGQNYTSTQIHGRVDGAGVPGSASTVQFDGNADIINSGGNTYFYMDYNNITGVNFDGVPFNFITDNAMTPMASGDL